VAYAKVHFINALNNNNNNNNDNKAALQHLSNSGQVGYTYHACTVQWPKAQLFQLPPTSHGLALLLVLVDVD